VLTSLTGLLSAVPLEEKPNCMNILKVGLLWLKGKAAQNYRFQVRYPAGVKS